MFGIGRLVASFKPVPTFPLAIPPLEALDLIQQNKNGNPIVSSKKHKKQQNSPNISGMYLKWRYVRETPPPI